MTRKYRFYKCMGPDCDVPGCGKEAWYFFEPPPGSEYRVVERCPRHTPEIPHELPAEANGYMELDLDLPVDRGRR